MSKHNVVELAGREQIRDELTDLIRAGACKLIAQGLELEVGELLSALSGRQDEAGRAAVVRNGYQPERDIQTGIGPDQTCIHRKSFSTDQLLLHALAHHRFKQPPKYIALMKPTIAVLRERRVIRYFPFKPQACRGRILIQAAAGS